MTTALAEELMELHDHPREVPMFSARHPGLTPESGYEAARALHHHRLARGWKPLGRKIGFTNRTIWPRYGVYEPIWGTVYDRTVTWARRDEAVVPLAGHVQPRIEPEICFRMKSAPAISRDPTRLLDAIEWVAHSVEIVQCHHPGWKLTLADSTADNGLHAHLIVGTPVPVSEIPGLAGALPLLEVTLRKDGAAQDRGIGANVLGSPLLALVHLLELLDRQREAPPLEAGEIVSTGTLTDAHPVAAGERWTTDFSGLPIRGLAIEFT